MAKFNFKQVEERELTWLNKGSNNLQDQSVMLRRKTQKCQLLNISCTYMVTVHNTKQTPNQWTIYSEKLVITQNNIYKFEKKHEVIKYFELGF